MPGPFGQNTQQKGHRMEPTGANQAVQSPKHEETQVVSRLDGRTFDSLRSVRLTPHVVKHPAGSVMVEFGDTKVLCCASVEERVPPFLFGKGQGWVTAEYSLLPASTHTRNQRESSKGKISGRTHEIQRLIGRALRMSLDLKRLGERTVSIDCDVIQADGGTRTASITGAYVALALAMDKLKAAGKLEESPLITPVAAVSVGIWKDHALLDLCYEEDSACEVDMNLVMTGEGHFVEVQGTAEGRAFTAAQLSAMLEVGQKGIRELLALQQWVLEQARRS